MACTITMPALFDTGPLAFAAVCMTATICFTIYKLRSARAQPEKR